MKTFEKTLAVCLSLAALLALVVVLGLGQLKRDIAAQRRQAERAVTKTVESIRRLEQRGLSIDAFTNAAVAPASVTALGTNPLLFRVEARTAWPDGMIYEYDSRAPEKGVHHYLF